MESSTIKTLCDVSPMAAVVLKKDGTIIFFNPSAAELIRGLEAGKQMSEYIILDSATDLNESQLTFDAEEVPSLLRGHTGIVIAAIIRRSIDERSDVMFIRNISNQAEYIHKVNEQQKTEILLSRSTHIKNGDLDKALQEIAIHSSRTMNVSRVNIWTIDETFSSIKSMVNYDDRKEGFLENITLYRHQFPEYFNLMQTAEIIPTEDALHDPKTYEIREAYILPLGIRSLLDIPIRTEGKMTGVICFEDTERTRKWDPAEKNFALAIAQYVAQTLETHQKQVTQKALEKALAEKKLLLAEVNQRVKNNFSLILDLLRLQESKAENEKQKELFSEIRARISSMAMIHRQLYLSENIGSINFRDFLLDLAAHFRTTFAIEGVEISTMLDNCKLPLSKAVLGGLVINELLTSSARNSITKTAHTEISMRLNYFNERITLTIADNNSENVNAHGLGNELVNELIGRLDGKLEKRSGRLNETILSFSTN